MDTGRRKVNALAKMEGYLTQVTQLCSKMKLIRTNVLLSATKMPNVSLFTMMILILHAGNGPRRRMSKDLVTVMKFVILKTFGMP